MKLRPKCLRGFSAVELILVMVVGVALMGYSLRLMITITQRARDTEARGRMIHRSTAALDSLNLNLDYRIPANLPGWDYSMERYGADRIVFLSSRRIKDQNGEVVLAEYKIIDPPKDADKAALSLGSRLVRIERTIRNNSIIETKDLKSFGPDIQADIFFYYNEKQDPTSDAQPVLPPTSRPTTISIKIRTTAGSQIKGVGTQELVAYWREEGSK